jgi:hypothetical protein
MNAVTAAIFMAYFGAGPAPAGYTFVPCEETPLATMMKEFASKPENAARVAAGEARCIKRDNAPAAATGAESAGAKKK